MIKASVITIGDEILIGQIIDSNSGWINNEVTKLGFQIINNLSIADTRDAILQALKEQELRVDIIFITGGLGPTKDDITKKTLAEFFNSPLVENQQALEHVHNYFAKANLTGALKDLQKKQAEVPLLAEVIINKLGTAPCMWFEKDVADNKVIFIAMPGVPDEMKSIMTSSVMLKLKNHFNSDYYKARTLLIFGVGEAIISNILENFEDNLNESFKLAYLPNLNQVRLRLSLRVSADEMAQNGITKITLDKKLADKTKQIYELIHSSLNKKVIFGEEEIDGDLLSLTTQKLIAKNYFISTAESCTGGALASFLTSIDGASKYFVGSMVSYATRIKTKLLEIPSDLIDAYSVTSLQVAEAMALNARLKFKTDFALATTGNTNALNKESSLNSGEVFIALAYEDNNQSKVISQHLKFQGDRNRVIQRTNLACLMLLLSKLEQGA